MTYFITALAIQQNPANLDDLGRVLGHIYTVFVAGRGYVDNDVSVQLGDSRSGGRHLAGILKLGVNATERSLVLIVEKNSVFDPAATAVSRKPEEMEDWTPTSGGKQKTQTREK